MSFSPGLSLVRLQELKLWQGSYDNLLQKSRNKTEQDSREAEAHQGSFDLSSHSLERKNANPGEWDRKQIAPMKPFEQLLEEKLAENPVPKADPKPKKPFLRKGEGLARFRMGPCHSVKTQHRAVATRKQEPNHSKGNTANQAKAPVVEKKGILKRATHPDVDLSPLTVPDFVKPRGTWKHVFESSGKEAPKNLVATSREADYGVVDNYEQFRKSLSLGEAIPVETGETLQGDYLFKTSSNKDIINAAESDSEAESADLNRPDSHFLTLNKEILQTVNDYAKTYFDGQVTLFSNEIPKELSGLNAPKIVQQVGDLTMEELRREKELNIFEKLEAKVNNSSFCSTNTSIVNLLASTPQKAEKGLRDEEKIVEKEDESFDISEEFTYIPENVKMKLREVCRKKDVLEQFLINLQNTNCNPDVKPDKAISTNTSFSDENTRWSTRSPSLSDTYTEFESTCESSNKIDVGINTSFNSLQLDETIKDPQPCRECENLRTKYCETKSKMADVKAETTAMRLELNDLQREYDKLKKLKKKDAEIYEERLEKLEDDLNCERKKFSKERTFFENYVKEAQNRPSKKEREEITKLKQELADIKELVKLKDTKSGATQARLRTQIKQQEKEICELKLTVEKLQKENAKLTASQKYARRPQEVKMLHEINKNLSKLAEKTLVKQLNKSGHGDPDDQDIDVASKNENINGQVINKDNEKVGKNIRNLEIGKHVPDKNKENIPANTVTFQDTPMDSDAIERQYQNMFGNLSSPRNVNSSTSVEKSEKVLDDGSIEIIYSNGNLKTISVDGKIIRMNYFNGDTKETNLNKQTIKYYYAATDLWHIQHPDGTEVMEFKDGHKSTKLPDGKTQISYPDGSFKTINDDGTEVQTFPDGRKTLKNVQGEQIIYLPNGQREIHTQEYKRREYPDGTMRTLHKDGTVETVYPNGRVRLKDANGVLVMDTHQT